MLQEGAEVRGMPRVVPARAQEQCEAKALRGCRRAALERELATLFSAVGVDMLDPEVQKAEGARYV